MEDVQRPWSFDVSALMVLVGETEESKYRFMQRSLIESLMPHPIVGLQCYLHSYDWLLPQTNLTLFSPYSRKSAPLINHRLASFIIRKGYLDDGALTVLRVPKEPKRSKVGFRLCLLWASFSWILFACIMTALFLGQEEKWLGEKLGNATWIGRANCSAYACWSMIVRLIEHRAVRLHKPRRNDVTNPDDEDAIYIMGRSESCFVLEGRRIDIKQLTECGLHFWGTRRQDSERKKYLGKGLQYFLRTGTLLLLLFIFTTIPNGSTFDQVGFIVFNILGQANVLLGQRLNAQCLYETLEKSYTSDVRTRTHTYAFLLRRWRDQGDWSSMANLLPDNETWKRWKKRILEDKQDDDPKTVFDIVAREVDKEEKERKEFQSLSRTKTD